MKKPPKGIRSIEVGFRLLKALERASTPLQLKTLAAAAGMTSAKAYPYMVSFVRARIIRQDPMNGYYGLGPFARQIGASSLRQLNVVEVARREFAGLRDATQCGVYLSVWGSRGPTIVSKTDGIYQGSLSIKVGHVLPLLTTATGRIFLAFMDSLETRDLAQEEWTAQLAASRRRHPRSIATIVSAIRKQGYAEMSKYIGRREGFVASLRQVNPPFGALSCPMFDPLGQLVAALSILVPVEVQEEKGRSQFLPLLQAAAARASEEIGVRAVSAAPQVVRNSGQHALPAQHATPMKLPRKNRHPSQHRR